MTSTAFSKLLDPAPEARPFSFRQVGRFIWANKIFILYAPLIVILGTLIHELAHCLAVWVQGGEVTSLVIIPIGGAWGHMSFAPDPEINPWWVEVAPFFLWSVTAVVAGVGLAFCHPGRMAKFLFLTAFILPVMDVAMGFMGLYGGSERSDYYKALSGLEGPILPLVVIYILLFGTWGWRIFKSIAPKELGWVDYSLGFVAMLVITCAV